MHSLNIASVILAQYDYVKHRDNYINMRWECRHATCTYIIMFVFSLTVLTFYDEHTNWVIFSKFDTILVSNQIYINKCAFWCVDLSVHLILKVTFQFKALIININSGHQSMRGSESSVITWVLYKDHQYRSNYLILNHFF